MTQETVETSIGWTQIILAVITLIGSIVTPIIAGIGAYFMFKLKISAEKAATKVENVAVTLEASDAKTDHELHEIKATGEKIHTLVNSNMGIQLQLNAKLSRRVADQSQDPADIEVANASERMYQEHQGKQALVDNGQATG